MKPEDEETGGRGNRGLRENREGREDLGGREEKANWERKGFTWSNERNEVSLFRVINNKTLSQLSDTTMLLDEQKHMYHELKLKLKSIDVEDERRREKSVVDMDNYYKNKLNDIQTELVCFSKIIN